MNTPINTISLFTGCGGLDLGFEAADFRVGFMADILKEAAETLRVNHPNTFVFGPPNNSGDISELSSDYIFTNSNLTSGSIDMIIGGPPCQPFSVAAAQRFLKSDERFKRKGFDCDEKGMLIFEYLRLIKETKPKAFLIENVPGIIKIDDGKTIADLKLVLEELGYKVKIMILDVANFGIPQSRKRAFIIGNSLGIDFLFPRGDFGSILLDKKPFRNVAQALANIPAETANNETRIHTIESIKRYTKLAVGSRDKLGRVDRLNPLLPSKTIIAGGTKGGGRSHLHPFLARTLSVRESARLQTFPDSYIFCGKVSRQFTQVGNAVPPLMAEILARSIGEQIFGLKYSSKLKMEVDYMQRDEAYSKLLNESLQNDLYNIYADVEVSSKQVYELFH